MKVNRNFNTPEEVAACQEPMSFDGVYESVYNHRELLRGKDVTLFVVGHYIGKDNSFDKGQPIERFCTQEQIDELVQDYGCKLGWHTNTHPDLTKLSAIEMIVEMKPMIQMDIFAYPYGKLNAQVVEAVKSCGYKQAYSVYQGDNTEYQLNREYL